MEKKTVAKAYVLSDGEIIEESTLERYTIKQQGESRAIPSDRFDGKYGELGLVEPLYNFEALAQLLEINPYHYRAVKTKARDTAGLGWYLEAKTNNPSEQQREIAMQFLENPNPYKTLTDINNNVMVDYDSIGNGYYEVIRAEDGTLVGLEHIPAHTVRVHQDMNRYCQIRGVKKVWFKRFGFENDVDYVTGEIAPAGSIPIERRATEIIHVHNYTSRSDYYGLPDILPALSAIISDRERAEYNISFFENHAVPAYVVTVTGAELDEQTKQLIRRYFQQDIKKNRHSTLVVTAQKPQGDFSDTPIEIKFQALSVETKEASFRMLRADNRDEILSAHGVPPYRAGIVVEGSLGGSTARESTEIYKQSVIEPRQDMLENVMNRLLLIGLGVTDWRFRFKDIDTKDTQAKIEELRFLFEVGAYSPNMILRELGRDPIDDPNLDRHFIFGQPLDASQEETNAILNSLKQLHAKLIDIATKEGGKHV
ncbi:phage portal protein [Geobacillus stearothermophilus]|uniref:phage portal protein n=1 Tax=Geobacillus TaxID=129337 RepID=UPI0009BCAB11|nr:MULTISPECIES: phage portal protein [Geobacillus]MED5040809.1 phage portal protein [Geobacillus stearothermophilus]OQP10638.1 phage portal protein [Geobacillus thermoleovorans]OQP16167.1 phage portal protein [Geobacillus zalihae]